MVEAPRRSRWLGAVAGVAVAAALVGAATAPRARPSPTTKQQPISYATLPRDHVIPVQPMHILWINIHGHWRAVPR